jgi:hypothetical protein
MPQTVPDPPASPPPVLEGRLTYALAAAMVALILPAAIAAAFGRMALEAFIAYSLAVAFTIGPAIAAALRRGISSAATATVQAAKAGPEGFAAGELEEAPPPAPPPARPQLGDPNRLPRRPRPPAALLALVLALPLIGCGATFSAQSPTDQAIAGLEASAASYRATVKLAGKLSATCAPGQTVGYPACARVLAPSELDAVLEVATPVHDALVVTQAALDVWVASHAPDAEAVYRDRWRSYQALAARLLLVAARYGVAR